MLSYQKCYIWLFFGKNLKTIFSYLKTPSWIFLIAEFREKRKMAKFGQKNSWFAYFSVVIWKYYCHNWNLCPWVCLAAKVGAKIKIFKFGTKNAWFWYFGVEIWEKFWHIWNQPPQNCVVAKFNAKIKIRKFGTKMSSFFVYGLEHEKNIVVFEISTLIYDKNSRKDQMFSFETKNPLSVYLLAGIWTEYSHIRNQHPGTSIAAKFCLKMPKFKTNNAWFAHFSAGLW